MRATVAIGGQLQQNSPLPAHLTTGRFMSAAQPQASSSDADENRQRWPAPARSPQLKPTAVRLPAPAVTPRLLPGATPGVVTPGQVLAYPSVANGDAERGVVDASSAFPRSGDPAGRSALASRIGTSTSSAIADAATASAAARLQSWSEPDRLAPRAPLSGLGGRIGGLEAEWARTARLRL